MLDAQPCAVAGSVAALTKAAEPSVKVTLQRSVALSPRAAFFQVVAVFAVACWTRVMSSADGAVTRLFKPGESF